MPSRWLSPCLFGHGQPVYSRTNGVLSWQCERCQQSLGPVLAGDVIRTPLPQEVAGQPAIKARRVVRQNVAPWKVTR